MIREMAVKTSVIIPSYNGIHRLPTILNSLSIQTWKDFEAVIVIDGSTDGSEEYLSQSVFTFPVIVHKQENKGRASVRNKGAELSSGELLIFFDDDMRLEPGCVEAHIKHHFLHKDTILTGAQIDDYQKAQTDFQKYKCKLSRTWASKLNKQKGQPLQFNSLYLTAANFSISKKLFCQIGGFNEQLRDCEDYDLASRAYNQNIAIYYSEDAFGWHDDFQTPSSFIKRQLDYKEYNEKLYQLYPNLYGHLLRSRLNKPGRLKSAFFYLFKSAAWVNAVEKNRLLFLPQKFRYKLYNWIITAHSTYKVHL